MKNFITTGIKEITDYPLGINLTWLSLCLSSFEYRFYIFYLRTHCFRSFQKFVEICSTIDTAHFLKIRMIVIERS